MRDAATTRSTSRLAPLTLSASHLVTYGLTDLLTDARSPISLRDAVAVARRPVLLIAAGKVADESNAGRSIQAGAPNEVTLWVVPGADHTGGLATQPAEWEQRVTTFLDDALGIDHGDSPKTTRPLEQ